MILQISLYRPKLFGLAVILLLIFLASAFVAAHNAYDPSLSWPVLLAMLVSISLFLVIAGSPLSPWPVSKALVVIAALLAFYFVGQYRHFNYELEFGYVPALGRLTSAFMPNLVFFTPHPNAVASFLEGVLLISLVITWRTPQPARWIWLALTAIIAYGLFITESRGAWAGVAITLAIWLLLTFGARVLPWLAVGLGVAGGILVGAYVILTQLAPQQEILFITPTLNTLNGRLLLYQNSFDLMQDYLFSGIGLGETFGMVFSRYQLFIHVPYLYYAHNIFISIGLGQGLWGLASFIGLIGVFFYFVFRVERSEPDPASQMLFRAAWLGVTAGLIHGFVDSIQFSGAVWTMPVLFVLAGLAVAAGRPALEQPRRRNLPAQPANSVWGVGAAVVVLVLVLGALSWRSLAGSWYANLGAIAHTRADLASVADEAMRDVFLAQATDHFDAALNMDPNQPTARRRLGLIALDQLAFDTAVEHLEQAYQHDPTNQATLKLLGYAYLYTGQIDAAETMFRRLGFMSRLRLAQEFEHYEWYWNMRGWNNLSAYAGEMAQRMSP